MAQAEQGLLGYDWERAPDLLLPPTGFETKVW